MFSDPLSGAIVMAGLATAISTCLFYPVVVDLRDMWRQRRLAKQIRQWCDADARHRSLMGDTLIDEIRIRYDGLPARKR